MATSYHQQSTMGSSGSLRHEPASSRGVTIHTLLATQAMQLKSRQSDPFHLKPALQGKANRAANSRALPPELQAGVYSLSGHDLSDVQVHYNSSKPATVQAHAFAQGNQIHLAPGQDKHLAHEAWHVVQQRQGRVKPTMQLKHAAINDDAALEREADVMGTRAQSLAYSAAPAFVQGSGHGVYTEVMQRAGAPPAKDSAEYLVGKKLKDMKGSTSAGWLKKRSDQLKRLDARIAAVGEELMRGDYNLNQVGSYVLKYLNKLDEYFQRDYRLDDNDKTRRRKYLTWRDEILVLLGADQLGQWFGDAAAEIPAKPDAQYAQPEHRMGFRVAPRQEGGVNLGADDELGVGHLKSNDYVAINDAFRYGRGEIDGFYMAGKAVVDYRSRGGKLIPGPGYPLTRYADTLMGGKLPDELALHAEVVDRGFSFFGGNASQSDDKRYKMSVQLNACISYRSTMYGEAEADWEYVTLPGARFRFLGVTKAQSARSRDVYRFAQV